MGWKFQNTARRILVGALVAAALGSASVSAGETEDALKEMKARLDAMEKQNQEMRRLLEQGRNGGVRPAVYDEAKDKTEEKEKDKDAKSVKNVVDDYLKEKDEKKKVKE